MSDGGAHRRQRMAARDQGIVFFMLALLTSRSLLSGTITPAIDLGGALIVPEGINVIVRSYKGSSGVRCIVRSGRGFELPLL